VGEKVDEGVPEETGELLGENDARQDGRLGVPRGKKSVREGEVLKKKKSDAPKKLPRFHLNEGGSRSVRGGRGRVAPQAERGAAYREAGSKINEGGERGRHEAHRGWRRKKRLSPGGGGGGGGGVGVFFDQATSGMVHSRQNFSSTNRSSEKV